MADSRVSAGSTQFIWALLLALAMAVVVGTALAFEHIGGFIPCKLCLTQRDPYYFGIPVMLFAALAAWVNWPGWISRGALLIGAALMAYGLYLSIYHAGVEWKFWPGPTDCGATTGNIATDAGSLLGDLDAARAPQCDDAAGRFLGLSFAGWNVITSFILCAVALRAALVMDHDMD